MSISISISPYVTEVTPNNSVIVVEAYTTFVTRTGLVFPAENITVEPYGPITAVTLQEAIEQLADQSFRSSTTPSGANIEEGDTWYNTETEQFNVYRETSPTTFEWVPIILGDATGDSDLIDAGAF